MINIITGTVRNMVHLAEMDNKWMQKKEGISKKKLAEMEPEARQVIQYKEDMEKIREGNQMSSIDVKMKAGEDLTPEEIAYLKKHNPEAYKEYLEVKQESEAYEKKLKECKTKEETERLKLNKMGNFMAEAKSIANNPNIPKQKKLKLMEKLLKKVMGVEEKQKKFNLTTHYQNLPTEEEIRKREKETIQKGQEEKISPDRQKEQESREIHNIKEDITKEFTDTLLELHTASEKILEEVKKELMSFQIN